MIIVEIAGFLGSDPEERYTATGKKVIGFRVGVKVRQGGRDETVWWRVNVWGDRFDKMLPHLKKGSSVIIIGEMAKPEIYTGKDGVAQISLTLNAEIIKFSPFGRPEKSNERSQGEGGRAPVEEMAFANASFEKSAYGSQQEDDATSDNLPF